MLDSRDEDKNLRIFKGTKMEFYDWDGSGGRPLPAPLGAVPAQQAITFFFFFQVDKPSKTKRLTAAISGPTVRM